MAALIVLILAGGPTDTWVAEHLRRPIAWACRVTGRSNFWLARWLLVLSAVLLLADLMSAVTADITWAGSWAVVGSGCYMLGYWGDWRRYGRIEEQLRDLGGGVPLRFLFDVRLVCRWRIRTLVASTFLVEFDVLTGHVPVFGLGVLLWGLAGYAACQATPPGQSSWSRAKDRIKSWRPLPVLRPSTA